jgi:glycosyltransferase involved in cell wall biosynthesis
MKIFLDPQIFYLQKFGGISRIFAEFWSNCNKAGVKIICPLFYCDNLHLRENNLQPKMFNLLYDKKYPGKKYVNAVAKKINRKKAAHYLRKNNFDIFISTYYNDYFLDKLHGKPFILTVFDMIHEIFPAHFPADSILNRSKKKLAEKSGAIVAISQSTKNDILKFYTSLPGSKIKVIHLSQSINPLEKRELDWLPGKYVLFVGKRELYKQFDILVKAMLPVFKADPAMKLVCAGGGSLTGSEKTNLKTLELTDKVIQHDFYDNELATIYTKARVFIFPSDYEGFGIPALEAMACGCPVILSNTSSLPEIAGDAAYYFTPGDTGGLSAAIFEILKNDQMRNSLIEKGYHQVQLFSWEKMTKEYLETVTELLNP